MIDFNSFICYAILVKGVNVVMANDNPDLNEYISMVPTSAFLGDGIGNIMAHIINDSQNRLAEKLAYCEELDCTVMEVKKIAWFFLIVVSDSVRYIYPIVCLIRY